MELLFGLAILIGLIWWFKNRNQNFSPSSDAIDWSEVKENSKYFHSTPNGMWKIGIVPGERALYVKNDRRRENVYSFDDVRGLSVSKDGNALTINVRDVDFPDWRFGIGRKFVTRWREIILQEILEEE